MKPIPLSKQQEIAKNWRDVKQAFARQQRLIAELAAHPEVTDQMILERVRELGKTYKAMREMQKSLCELDRQQQFAYCVHIDPSF